MNKAILLFPLVLMIMIVSCGGTNSGPKCEDPTYIENISEKDCADQRIKSDLYVGCREYQWTKNPKDNLGLCKLSNCRCASW
jgi:hypothetical protein